MKKTTILRTIMLGGLLASAWIGGCATDPADSAQPENTGQIGIDLQLAPGLTLDAVSYTITGPSGFSRTGSIDVTNSTTISAIISGIPFGAGYQITLRGTTVDGTRRLHAARRAFDIDGPGGQVGRAPHDLRAAARHRQHPDQRHRQRVPAHRRHRRQPGRGRVRRHDRAARHGDRRRPRALGAHASAGRPPRAASAAPPRRARP